MARFRVESTNTPDAPMEFDMAGLFSYMNSAVIDFPSLTEYARTIMNWASGTDPTYIHPFTGIGGEQFTETWTRIEDSEA